MAVPKKKISRRRRDNRRYSYANQLKPVNYIMGEDQQPVRAHRESSVEDYNRKYAVTESKSSSSVSAKS